MTGEQMEEPVLSGEFGEDPLSDVLLANQDREVATEIKHKMPVTGGLSFHYRLSYRWGVNTGLTYTQLSSELSSGSDVNLIRSRQTLHYIGVPIQVNYILWEKRKFSAYTNAGAHLQKSVSGKLETSYIMNNVSRKEPTENLAVKPLQVSLTTGIGTEYRLPKNLGVYFEPGMVYHFNDDSGIQTIYKEKPFNFNIRFGIRYTIN
ncbi:MAG: PorT family protein [Leadbetterella sp.]|nr:PorT family protein [Leadbetterella sp.]